MTHMERRLIGIHPARRQIARGGYRNERIARRAEERISGLTFEALEQAGSKCVHVVHAAPEEVIQSPFSYRAVLAYLIRVGENQRTLFISIARHRRRMQY